MNAAVEHGDVMAACPDLALLEEAPRTAAVRDHITHCTSCSLVADLFDSVAEGAALDVADCTQFDALLAARTDGTLALAGINLLQRHLAGCAECRAVAETLSPTADTEGDHATLPSVDPAGYALGLEIARGGMGRVIAARDLRVGRPVAVKELLGRSPQLAARFEREARVTARLQHPGIVPIYEIGKWPDGTPFYSMRMVDGRTLRDALAAAPTLGERLALLPALISAASAVAFAHAQRVIHRDLTPANVIVGAYGETVVIDWGLAKDLAATDEADSDDPYRSASSGSLTNVGAVIGTAPYMPPEQAHAQPVDERADVYALGAILYHLLAGVAPYEGPTTAALLRAVKTGPPRPIDAIVSGAPRDLVSIADKAMAREPEARYPSARELADELERFRTGRMVEAHEYSTRDRVRRFVRRHRAAVIATLAAALVLAVVGVIAVTRVLRSRTEARETARELLGEKGRIEVLAGNTLGALAYLHAATARSSETPALAFLVDAAIRSAPASTVLDCGGYAFSIAFSPDGTMMTAACTRQARTWRLADRTLVATMGPFEDGFSGARYTPDGTAVVTWGKTGVARLWDAKSGVLRQTFTHGAEISRASFTPDGARLLTTGFDGHARLWDTASAQQVVDVEVTTGLFEHVYGTLDPAGALILTQTIEGEGRAWDATTGEARGGFSHGAFTLGGDVALDGRHAASCGVDRMARIWNAQTGGPPVHTLAGHTDVIWRCIFDRAGTHLLTTGHDGRANVWDVETGALVASVVHRDVLTSAEMSPDGRRFVTIGVGGSVKVWDARSGALVASVDARNGKNAQFTPNSRGLVVQRGDGRLEIWDELSNQDVAFAPAKGTLAGIALDGRRAIVESPDGWLELWDTASGTMLPLPRAHRPIAVANQTIVATVESGTAIIDPATGETLATLPVTASSIAVASDGSRIGLALPAGSSVIYDTATRAKLGDVPGTLALLDAHGSLARTEDRWSLSGTPLPFTGDLTPIGFALAGTRLVVLESPATSEQAVAIYDARARLLRRMPATTARIDPSGRWLTITAPDRVVRTLSLEDAHEVSAFEAEELDDAQIDARRALVAAIAEHGQVALVIDAATGRVLARWPLAHEMPVLSQTGFRAPRTTAAWSSDGSKVITRASGLTVWHAAGRAESLASVMRRVPWRIVNGRAVALRDRTLRGRVVRGGNPVAGAQVAVEIRISPDVGLAERTWDSVHTRFATHTLTTDDDGHFELPGVAPGAYRVAVTSGTASRTFDAYVAADLDDESDQELVLE
ncbi:MAG: protein kinase [Kofleriaceae bacterium]